MSQLEKSRLAFSRLVVGALAFTFVLQACGDDDDPAGPGPIVQTGGASGNGSGGNSGGSAEGGAPALGGADGSGGASVAGGNGGGDAGGNTCLEPDGPDGCYACEPSDGKTIQFLNRCTDSGCSKFDNAARIPDFVLPLPPL